MSMINVSHHLGVLRGGEKRGGLHGHTPLDGAQQEQLRPRLLQQDHLQRNHRSLSTVQIMFVCFCFLNIYTGKTYKKENHLKQNHQRLSTVPVVLFVCLFIY